MVLLQVPSIGLYDLSLFFAINAIMLLIVAELTLAYYGPNNFVIEKRKLKVLAFPIGIVSLIIVALYVLNGH